MLGLIYKAVRLSVRIFPPSQNVLIVVVSQVPQGPQITFFSPVQFARSNSPHHKASISCTWLKPFWHLQVKNGTGPRLTSSNVGSEEVWPTLLQARVPSTSFQQYQQILIPCHSKHHSSPFKSAL